MKLPLPRFVTFGGICLSILFFLSAAAIVGCEDRDSDVAPPAESVSGDVGQRAQLAANTAETPAETATPNAIIYPTGQQQPGVGGALKVEKIGPSDVRVGQPYEYTIRVTNLTDAPLAGVRVQEFVPADLDIEQSQPKAQFATANVAVAGGSANAATQPSASSSAQPATQPADQAQANAAQGQQQQMRRATWQIGELGANESTSIQVRAFPSQPGALATCITADYQPALCTLTQVVKPVLRVAKQGPQQVDICEPITYTYTIWNDGTGTLQGVRIEDPLADGLITADEQQQQVAIDVGDIPQGESRDFKVQLRAKSKGEFTSRAVARSASDEAYSNRLTTQVLQPALDVSVQAPEWTYIGQNVTYQVKVTNTGNAPARQVSLNINAPDGVQLVQDPRQINPQQQNQQQATGANGANVEAGDEAELAAATESPEQPGTLTIGQIQPGQTRTVQVVLRGASEGPQQITAVAAGQCAPEARAAAQLYVATIPALQVEVVDGQDPVQVGGQTTYTIALVNEGSGTAKNVTVNAALPQSMRYVGGQGDTEVQADGNNLRLAPIPTLAPQQAAQWQITAQAMQPAHAQFRVEVNSDSLDQAVVETEPTRLFAGAQQRPQQRPQQQGSSSSSTPQQQQQQPLLLPPPGQQ